MKLKKSCHFQKNQLSTSHPCSISFNQRFLSDRVHTFHFYFCGKVYPQGVWWSDDVMLVSQLHQKCITVGPWISRCLWLCCCTLTFQNLHFKLYDILKHKKFSIGFLDELGNFKQKKIYISKCRFYVLVLIRLFCLKLVKSCAYMLPWFWFPWLFSKKAFQTGIYKSKGKNDVTELKNTNGMLTIRQHKNYATWICTKKIILASSRAW